MKEQSGVKLLQERRDVIDGFSPSFTRNLLEGLKDLKDTEGAFRSNGNDAYLTQAAQLFINQLSLQIGIQFISVRGHDRERLDEFVDSIEIFLKSLEGGKVKNISNRLLEELAELEYLLGMLKEVEEEDGIYNNSKNEVKPIAQWILGKIIKTLDLGWSDILSIPKDLSQKNGDNIEKFILMAKRYACLLRVQFTK